MSSNNEGVRAAARAARLKVFQPVEIDYGAGPVRAHLLDLSRSGALLHSAGVVDKGQSFWIVLGHGRHRARVAWRNDKRFGIEFIGKLSDAQIDDVLALQTSLATAAATLTEAARAA